MNDQVPAGRNDGHKFDYSKITDQIYIGSDLCKGGICKIHGDEFKSLGVNVEINLSAERNELPPKELEVAYCWLPTVDGHSPGTTQLDMGTAIMQEAIKDGKVVYVHCTNGHGRSPTLVAAYLIRFGRKSVDEAINTVITNRREAHFEKEQKTALEEFERKWSM